MCPQPSPSPRRAWIEIFDMVGQRVPARVALPTEGVDRNQPVFSEVSGFSRSPSPRRAWIEISWNLDNGSFRSVALPTEGVDRNMLIQHLHDTPPVALPTEGVDRNSRPTSAAATISPSPSPRRAWIEIFSGTMAPACAVRVALPTEGVDRNQTV